MMILDCDADGLQIVSTAQTLLLKGASSRLISPSSKSDSDR